MRHRRDRLVAVAILLVLLQYAVLAAGTVPRDSGMAPDESPAGGFGQVFPAPDSREVVDLPAPAPADVAGVSSGWPVTADPQPLFPPANSTRAWVAASDSTDFSVVVPADAPLFRCDGVDDEREINDAIRAARGGIVTLLDGTFRCHGQISLLDDTTLFGQGSQKTTLEITAKEGDFGFLPVAIDANRVNVGHFTLRGNGFVYVTKSHVRVHDVCATAVDLDGAWHTAWGTGMFSVWVAPPVTTIDDVEFYRCHAARCHTHGFNMNQDYGDRVARATTNIRLVGCSAVQCGYGVSGDPGIPGSVTPTNQSRSEWITGFDLHEWQDLVNCEVVECVAVDNWESGFHLEPGARYSDPPGPRTVSKNVVYRDCASIGNGQRNTYANHFFMSGYYLSRDTHLVNCTSNDNRNCGYYVHSGENSSFEDCTDDGSTYGWKVCKASSDIALAGCRSTNNPRWALWVSFSRRVAVDDFCQVGAGGDLGYQGILGWYLDEPAYQQPVEDSSFEIVSGGSQLPILNRAGSGNVYRLAWKGEEGYSLTTVPGAVGSPIDTGTDGLYDDVNGNFRGDFADVVLYFNEMDWIAANEPLELLDCNGNGRVDFADVTWLFNNL